MFVVAIGFVVLVLAAVGIVPVDANMPAAAWVFVCLIGLPALNVTGKVLVESANDGRLWARRSWRNHRSRRRFEKRRSS